MVDAFMKCLLVGSRHAEPVERHAANSVTVDTAD